MSTPDHRGADGAPTDAAEPQGANDPRPPMLGKRFAQTIATSMLVGLALALGAHALLRDVWWYGSANGWSWLIVGIGGLAVGGAFGLFLYGAATERTDTGPKPRGRADVSERGEWRKTLERRRARRRATPRH